MNEDKTSPEGIAPPVKTETSPHESPTIEVASRPERDQPTIITSGESFLAADISQSERQITNQKTEDAPWLGLLKWFGPVLLISVIFLGWIILDRVKRQRLFTQTSEVNSLLVQSLNALAHGNRDESAMAMRKIMSEFPDEPVLQEIYQELNRDPQFTAPTAKPIAPKAPANMTPPVTPPLKKTPLVRTPSKLKASKKLPSKKK